MCYYNGELGPLLIQRTMFLLGDGGGGVRMGPFTSAMYCMLHFGYVEEPEKTELDVEKAFLIHKP